MNRSGEGGQLGSQGLLTGAYPKPFAETEDLFG